jgi:LmbE family N-acetylglucosaminyl deacetylase
VETIRGADQGSLGLRGRAVFLSFLRRFTNGESAEAILARMRALPLVALDTLLGAAPSLILAPHPDDESLGCGGLIAACCAMGRPPIVVVLTDGAQSHPGSAAFPPARLVALRAAETREAVAALGLPPSRLHFMGLPDGQVPRAGAAMEHAAAALAAMARDGGVGTVLGTWEYDPHGDHVAAHAIASRAAVLAGVRLLSYPVWGWALPPWRRLDVGAFAGARIDITAQLPAKRRAIAAHASQHGAVVADDLRGFRLPTALLAALDQPFEVFLFPR